MDLDSLVRIISRVWRKRRDDGNKLRNNTGMLKPKVYIESGNPLQNLFYIDSYN